MTLPQKLVNVKPLLQINTFQGDWMRGRITQANTIHELIFENKCVSDYKNVFTVYKGTKSQIYISHDPPMFIKESATLANREAFYLATVNEMIADKQSPNFIILYTDSICYNCSITDKNTRLFCPTMTIELARPLKSSHLSKNIAKQYSFICQILLAIHALHARRIVHRDIRRHNMVVFSTTALHDKYFRYMINNVAYNVPCLNNTPAIVDFDFAFVVYENASNFTTQRLYARDVCNFLNFITRPGSYTYDSNVKHDAMNFDNTVVKTINDLRKEYPQHLGRALKMFKHVYTRAKFDTVDDSVIEEVFFPPPYNM